MWRALVVLATLAACLVTAARGRARSRLLDGDDDPLGSPGELAWQAWLLMDGSAAASSAASEAGGARRITPKSVFIAPAFAPQSLPPCADDHKRDAAGRCVQVVHINRDAQLNFLLQRLNSMHARPSGGRIPLPLRQQDHGPFRVRLRVPSPAAANISPDVLPAAATTTPAPSTMPVDDVQADESPSVSVVLADVSKRSNIELGASANDSDSGAGGNGDGSSSAEVPKPVLTVWTIEDNTPQKTQNQDTKDASSSSVDLPVTATEAANGSKDQPTTAPLEGEREPLSDALDSSEIEVVLPVLVISPGTSAPLLPTTTIPAQDAPTPAPNEQQPDAAATVAPEGSGEPPNDSDGAKDVLPDETVNPAGAVSSTEPGSDKDSPSKETEDDRESGSADVMEQIEVVPISENSRHDLPLESEDHDQDTSSFSQDGFASGLAGLFRPIPMDVPSHDETPYGNPVRFPTDARDEPQRFHLFKGNYLKFPTEHAYRYKHRPVTDTPDVKQTFWWVPSGWRIDQQRHQPALQDFWPRMPLNGDSTHFSQFNPSYHSPLPYQQRQAQYDPQWSSMKKQMSS